MQSRNMQFGKTKSLLGMAAGDVSNAQAMEAAGNQQRMAGIGDAIGGVTDIATSGLFGGAKTTGADASGQFGDFASYNEAMGGNMTQADWVAEQQNYLNLQNDSNSTLTF